MWGTQSRGQIWATRRLSLEGKECLAIGVFEREVAEAAGGDEVDFGPEEILSLIHI